MSQVFWFKLTGKRVFLMARIGRVLRGLHDDVVSEPLPPKLESLVRRLEESAA